MKGKKMGLNTNQKKAVETIEGPVLIIAGPGTGKTHTLVERVIYMVDRKKIEPGEIMVATFTNKAALELLDRLSRTFEERNIKKDVNDMLLGNFHSICRRVLDDYLDLTVLRKNYHNIDETEQRYLFYKYINDFRRIAGYGQVVNGYSIKTEISSLVKIVNTVAEEAILDRSPSNSLDRTIFSIVSLYEAILEKNNMLDFSRTLYYTYKLLYENPNVLDQVQKRTRYIMIDEYQDTNRVQEKIIFLLGSKNNNICVVGDDDQGLYRFRGASVKNILHFPKNFEEEVAFISLSENYRSDGRIIEFFTDFIRSGEKEIENFSAYRYDKSPVAFDQAYYENSVLRIKGLSEEDWIEKNLDLVEDLKEKGQIKSYNQLAFLFSSVNHPRAQKLKKALEKKGIGVYQPSLNTLLSRLEVHQLIGAFYWIFEDFISEDLRSRDRISQNFLVKCKKTIEAKNPELDDYVDRMKAYLKGGDFNLDLIDLAYRLFGYQPFSDYLDRGDQEAKNISRFLNLLESYSYINLVYQVNKSNLDRFLVTFFYDYIGFLKDEKVVEFEEDVDLPDKDSVSLLTIHKSKGMEYPVVVVGSLWDQVRGFRRPNPTDNMLADLIRRKTGEKSFEPLDQIELLDFYRKYYTAFSRAKNLLVLSGLEVDQRELLGHIFKEPYRGLRDYGEVGGLDLDVGPVKRAGQGQPYSYTSHILVYKTCPLSYKFFKNLKFIRPGNLATSYGSLVHGAIEEVNQALIRGESLDKGQIKEDLYSQARQAYRQGALGLSRDLIDQAYEEVLGYLEDPIFKPRASELEIAMARKNYLLLGKLDLLAHDDEGDLLIDFKTGSPPLDRPELLESYYRQVNLYSYLLEETKKIQVDRALLYFTQADLDKRVYWADRSQVDELLEEIDGIVEKIEAGQVNKKTEDKHSCNFCPLKYYCKRVD